MAGQVIAIGTDIIECSRIAGMIEKHGDTFVHRVFTSGEIDYCSNKKTACQHFAGRWAAKEAVMKTLGTGWGQGVQWTDIELVRGSTGTPSIRLSGQAAQIAARLGIDHVLISISHTEGYAIAFATAVG